ncbi:MAG TPA: hypothetical protein VH639_14815 [Bryobacteraceae bacterium]|jgi:hypothetical protein
MHTHTNIKRLAAIIRANVSKNIVFVAGWRAKAVHAGLGLALMALPSASLFAQSPFLPPPPPFVSTVPSNGDVNPYGVVFVPPAFPAGGTTQSGDILVSNFNNNQNLQGTGTTIIKVAPNGNTSLFFQGSAPGLTAALGVVQAGLIFIGNLPTTDGTPNTVQPGSVLVLNDKGQLLGTLAGQYGIDGPWGMAIHDQNDHGQIFISNVLSGTVIRLDVNLFAKTGSMQVRDSVVISSGYAHRTDPAALVLGPSGLAYDAVHDILYVAESADNTIREIKGAGALTSDAGPGVVIYQDVVHLHGPLDLAIAPNGHLLVANSDGSNATPTQPSEIVEFTTAGAFVTEFSVDPNNGGAFGLALQSIGGGTRFAAVDDDMNTLLISTIIP